MTADPNLNRSTAEILGAYHKELVDQGFTYEVIAELVRDAASELLRGDAGLRVKFS